MRAIISKVVTGSMIAGAALLVSACGGTTTTENTTVVDLNVTDTMGNEMTDDMTVIDGTNAGDMMMTNDTMVDNATNAM